jgi:hypothetical protein
MKKLTPWDIACAVDITIACGISYAVITQLLVHFVDAPSDLLGGMWAVISTVFIFRERRDVSLTAGWDRLLATCVSFALCLIYLLAFPFTPLGMVVVIGIGTVVMMLSGREDDVITMGITTAVVVGGRGFEPERSLAATGSAPDRHRGRDRCRFVVQVDWVVRFLPGHWTTCPLISGAREVRICKGDRQE